MKEMVGGCCVCSDERGWPENPLVYCDGGNCNVAVHQACYGIVTVPTGPWYCRKCESQERSARVRCELCPSRTGALKKTNTSGWAHVVCALYIPEVRFGNVTTMEPINLDSIPSERYGKTCYICQEMSKGSKATMGACMQCNKTGCRQQFHVTCAQQLGLLCEEAGNYLDNVKYCGYCQHHYSKLKKGGNVKLIPPYKPITYETGSSDGPSSPEKESETGGPGPSSSYHPGQPSLGETGGQVPSGISMLSNVNQGKDPTSTSTNNGSQLGSGSTNASNAAQSTASSTSQHATSGSSGSSSASSKNRKSSSSLSKGSSSSGTSGSAQNNAPGNSGQSTGSNSSSSTSASNSASKSSTGGSGGSSSNSGSSSKDYKDRHGKNTTSKATSSKDRDSYKEKSSKSSSSSSSASPSSAMSSSKNKDSHHAESQSKTDHKSMGGGGNKSLTNTTTPSILAPSVLQQASASKDAGSKYPYNTETNADSGVPDAASGNESKLTAAVGAVPNSSPNAPVASTKKRKASDSSKGHSSIMDEKMRDVSVTIVPLRSTPQSEKVEGGDSKKVKSERGSPSHSSSNESSSNLHQSTQSSSSPAAHSSAGTGGNLLATQTGATSISITKQPAGLPTTTNVIIKPPIIKDINSHLSSSQGGLGSGAGGQGVGCNGTSLVVSVPLSPVNLGSSSSSGGGGSSASQNLFQQAIQNRSEHLNFSSSGRSSSQSTGQSTLNRSSPIVSGMGGGDHLHGGMHHRQSPLIQSSLGMDSGSISGLSPQIGGNAVHQSDSGMLKVTYEKQPHPGRLTAIQDDVLSSSRRSSADSGIFQSSSSSAGTAKGVGLFNKRSSRDYGLVTSSSHVGMGEKEKLSANHPSNLFGTVTGTPSMAPFKASSAVSSVPTSSSAPTPFSSFINSSRTPDFNSFAGNSGHGNNSSSGGLKISYEPQAALSVTTTNTTLLTPSPSPSMSQTSGHSTSIAPNTIGAQPMTRDSPPSSPNSEAGSSVRKRSRKQHSDGGAGGAAKVFQNGVHASHMLGNQLNPNSSVAQKMSDQLHMELEAHSVYTQEHNTNLVGPMFPGKHSGSSSIANKTATTSQALPSLSSMLSGGSTAMGGAPQSLEQLLERQWEQGSQFLMEQAQHFDIASLLSCLHQLRAENVRLEDHVNNLVARRDHLLAVNARLAIPLNQASSGTGDRINMTSNGPTEAVPSNVIQREPSGSSRAVPGSGGSRAMSHGNYAMENGIDFRASAQQQQSMVAGVHHTGPSVAGGNPTGIVSSSFAGTMHR